MTERERPTTPEVLSQDQRAALTRMANTALNVLAGQSGLPTAIDTVMDFLASLDATQLKVTTKRRSKIT